MSAGGLQRLREHLKRSSPLEYLTYTLSHKIKRKLAFAAELKAKSQGTFPDEGTPVQWRNPLLAEYSFTLANEFKDEILAVAECFVNHQFDILGSGWLNWNFAKTTDSLTNRIVTPANLGVANEIRKHLPSDYLCIDWQRDIKSGFQFDSKTWWRKISIPSRAGADIKVPWEMARFQHLPTMALAFGMTKEDRYIREGLFQILDFISSNPPSYGVNWVSPMEAAIRSVNWILFMDLSEAAGFKIPVEIRKIIGQSLLKSGEFILANLEWHPYLRTNHYLANLVGILFIARRLNFTPVDTGRVKIEDIFLAEIDYQFQADGSNFEGSTCYHQLSMEMVVLGLAILEDKARANHLSAKLQGMGEFALSVRKPNSEVVQIGDNDSGRLVKIPWTSVDRQLNYDQVLSGWTRLLERPEETPLGKMEGELVRSLTHGQKSSWSSRAPLESNVIEAAYAGKPNSTREYHFDFDQPIDLKKLELRRFPDFGVYVARSSEFFLSFRVGGLKKLGLGGHFHNDQLVMELQVRGKDLISDPGSFTYTANPEIRNQYRSVKAHFAPQLACEPARLDQGLFYLVDDSIAELNHLSSTKMTGRHNAYGSWMERKIEISEMRVLVTDSYWGGEPLVDLKTLEPVTKSVGYGVLEKAEKLK